jgi:tetratricopeptide (TPR) repeat protein
MKLIFLYFSLFIILSCNTKNDSIVAQTMVERANQFYANNNYANAILSFDSLISNDTANGEYYFKKGYCESMQSDELNAIADYKKAIKYNYDKKEKAYLNVGVIYEGIINNYDSATYYLNECLKINPDNAKAKEKLHDIDTIHLLMDKARWHPNINQNSN